MLSNHLTTLFKRPQFLANLLVFVTLGQVSSAALAASKIGSEAIEKTYHQYCASCHGEKLTGGMGSNLIDDIWVHGGSDAEITKSIKEGQLKTGMPAWQGTLSDEQIRAMVVFIREQKFIAQEAALNKSLAPQEGVYQSEDYSFKLELAAEVDGKLWSLSFLPDGGWVAAESAGQLWYQPADANIEKILIKNTPKAWFFGQGGYLDVVAHPNYPQEPWLYLSYSENRGEKVDGNDLGMTKVVRGKIVDGTWQDEETIFASDLKYHNTKGGHFGSRIVFIDNYLYFSIGDRTEKQLAQDLTKPNGKIYRLHLDGNVPKDNPFVKQGGDFPSIWSYGHRNPQGLAVHPKTKQLWETEHGPRGGDEVNLIEKGNNYGWPVITYGINYNGTPITDKTAQAGMEQPKHYWVPSIAMSGIEFYQGKVFAKWQDNLLVSGLASKDFRRLVIENNQVVKEEILVQLGERIRDIAVSPTGDIYLVVNLSNTKSHIYKLIKQ